MAGETIITVVGNLTRDPELRTVGNGSTVVNFTIASSTRTFNRNTNQWDDGDTLFLNCSAWDSARTSMATNIANSLSKGMRVIAQGRLTQRSYQAQDGSQRSVVELRVDEIGPRVAATATTAAVTRVAQATPVAASTAAMVGIRAVRPLLHRRPRQRRSPTHGRTIPAPPTPSVRSAPPISVVTPTSPSSDAYPSISIFHV